MACRESELIRVLRDIVNSGSEPDLDDARRLLERIDEDEETIRSGRDPHGSDWGR